MKRMIYFLILGIVLLNTPNIKGQEGQTTDNNLSYSCPGTIDNKAVYYSGLAKSTMKFMVGNEAITVAPDEFYISKSDKDGNSNWVLSFGTATPKAIKTDSKGNVIIAGSFSEKLDLKEKILISSGEQDVFLIKLDRNGKIIWAFSEGGESSDVASSLAIGSNDDIYLGGEFAGFVMFGKYPGYCEKVYSKNQKQNNNDIFLAKYTSKGTLTWVKQAGGVFNDHCSAICVDNNENILMSGIFTRKAYFGEKGDILNVFSENNYSSFLAKYNEDGEIIWANSVGENAGIDVAADPQGNFYVTGRTLEVHSALETNTGNKSWNGFLAKYSGKGKLLWNKQLKAKTVSGYAIQTDKNSNAIVMGIYFGRLTDENGLVLGKLPIGEGNLFMGQYSKDGNLNWINYQPGSCSSPAKCLSVDKKGNAFIVGLSGVNRNKTAERFGFTNPENEEGIVRTSVVKMDSNYLNSYSQNSVIQDSNNPAKLALEKEIGE